MKATKVYPIYFSATGTTKKIVRQVAEGTDLEMAADHALIQSNNEEVRLTATDLAVVGIPVYAGRVSAVAAERLRTCIGNNTPAILVAVYGNRAYEDSLLEFKHIMQANGFRIIAAGAFVAEHSIFPVVANGRPDLHDMNLAAQFGHDSLMQYKKVIESADFPDIQIPGNNPYRLAGNVLLKPKGNRRCNKCSACVKACPVQAIPEDHPRRTDKTQCISCGHCIYVCPQHSRHFGGIIYRIASRKFTSAYGLVRKEPELFFAR